MATNLEYRLVVKDDGTAVLRKVGGETRRMGDSMKRIATEGSANFQRLRSSVLNLKTAIVAAVGVAGVGMLAKGFVDVSRVTEGYRTRLKFLLGSVEEGNRLFEEMSELATRLPYEYKDIMGASTALAGVMKGGVEEVKQWIPLISDLATVSGLSIQDTTSQVIRMYSAGAAAADMFRERGILAMLGFQAGVSYSAEETRNALISAWEDPESKFRDASKDMAKTWDGMLGMLADAWFQFRAAIMEEGPFEVMKDGIQSVLDEINRLKKEGDLRKWAFDIADIFTGVLGTVVGGFGTIINMAQSVRGIFMALKMTSLEGGMKGAEERIGQLTDRLVKLSGTLVEMEAGTYAPNLWQRIFGPKDPEEIRSEIRKIEEELVTERQYLNRMTEGYQEQVGAIEAAAEANRSFKGALTSMREGIEKLRADMKAHKAEAEETVESAKSSVKGVAEIAGQRIELNIDAQGAISNLDQVRQKLNEIKMEAQDPTVIKIVGAMSPPQPLAQVFSRIHEMFRSLPKEVQSAIQFIMPEELGTFASRLPQLQDAMRQMGMMQRLYQEEMHQMTRLGMHLGPRPVTYKPSAGLRVGMERAQQQLDVAQAGLIGAILSGRMGGGQYSGGMGAYGGGITVDIGPIYIEGAGDASDLATRLDAELAVKIKSSQSKLVGALRGALSK